MGAIIDFSKHESKAYLNTKVGFYFPSLNGRRLRLDDDGRYGDSLSFSFWLCHFSTQNGLLIRKGNRRIRFSHLGDAVRQKLDQWHFIVINASGEVYLDGKKLPVTINRNWNNNDLFQFMLNCDGIMAHLGIYDRDLTTSEISQLKGQAGYLPKSLQDSSTLSFHTMQPYPFLDSANIYGRGIEARVVFDSVAQFGQRPNNHAYLDTFSPEEIGATNKNLAIRTWDYYNKSIATNSGLVLDGVDEYGEIAQTDLPEISTTSAWCMVFDIENFPNPGTNTKGIFGNQNFDGGWGLGVYVGSQNDYGFFYAANILDDASIRAIGAAKLGRQQVIIAYNGEGLDVQNMRLYVDGKRYTDNWFGTNATDIGIQSDYLLGRYPFGSSPYGNIKYNRVDMYDFFPTDQQFAQLSKGKQLNPSKTFLFNEPNLTDTLGNIPITLFNKSAEDLLEGGTSFIEAGNNLPIIQSCLEISVGQSIEIPVVNCLGFSITGRFPNINSLGEILTGAAGLIKGYINGIEVTNAPDFYNTFNSTQVSHIDFEINPAQPLTGTITIAPTSGTVFLAKHAYYSRPRTFLESIKLANNLNFANPTPAQQEGIIHYYQCMQGSFEENGQLENRDLIGGNNAVVSGYADLGSLRGSVVGIEEVRG